MSAVTPRADNRTSGLPLAVRVQTQEPTVSPHGKAPALGSCGEGSAGMLQAAKRAAAILAVQFREVGANGPDEIGRALDTISKEHVGASSGHGGSSPSFRAPHLRRTEFLGRV